MLTNKRQEKEGEREREKPIFELDNTRKKKEEDRQKDVAKRYIAKNCKRHQKEHKFIIVYIKNFTSKSLYQKVYIKNVYMEKFILKSLYQSL